MIVRYVGTFFVNFRGNEDAMHFFAKMGIDIEKDVEVWCYNPEVDFAHYSGYYPFVGTFIKGESGDLISVESTSQKFGDWQTLDFGFDLDFELLSIGNLIIGFDVAFKYKVEEVDKDRLTL